MSQTYGKEAFRKCLRQMLMRKMFGAHRHCRVGARIFFLLELSKFGSSTGIFFTSFVF